MIDWVKEGRRTPEQAATYMTRFCSCGVFNPSRAAGFSKKPASDRSVLEAALPEFRLRGELPSRPCGHLTPTSTAFGLNSKSYSGVLNSPP